MINEQHLFEKRTFAATMCSRLCVFPCQVFNYNTKTGQCRGFASARIKPKGEEKSAWDVWEIITLWNSKKMCFQYLVLQLIVWRIFLWYDSGQNYDGKEGENVHKKQFILIFSFYHLKTVVTHLTNAVMNGFLSSQLCDTRDTLTFDIITNLFVCVFQHLKNPCLLNYM